MQDMIFMQEVHLPFPTLYRISGCGLDLVKSNKNLLPATTAERAYVIQHGGKCPICFLRQIETVRPYDSIHE